MEVKVKIRFDASSERFESYGGNRYLIYLPFGEDKDAMNVIIGLLSRKIGVPIPKIKFQGKDVMGNWTFELN